MSISRCIGIRSWGAKLSTLFSFGLWLWISLGFVWTAPSVAEEVVSRSADVKPQDVLKHGDLIFHTSASKQSYAIMWASQSLLSHVGVVERRANKLYVIEAIGRVSRTPLKVWLARGRMQRWEAYRDPRLDEAGRAKMVNAAKAYLGRSYDLHFTSGNREIYCSELVALAYEKVGLTLGQWQKVNELNVDNPLVRHLAMRRWSRHPVCRGVKSFAKCWPLILEDKLITPDSLAKDQKLERVFSNYP